MLTILLMIAMTTLLIGCGKDKNDKPAQNNQAVAEATTEEAQNDEEQTAGTEADNNDKNESAKSEEGSDDVGSEEIVYNNGGNFVKVGTKVYYIRPSADSIEPTELWGEFIHEYAQANDNEIMCYDTAIGGKATRVGNAEGNGRLVYYEGRLYGHAINDEYASYVFCTDIANGKSWKVADGTMVGADPATGRYAVRYYDDRRNNLSVYDGSNRIGSVEADVLASIEEAFVIGDKMIFRVTEGLEEYTTDNLFVYDVSADKQFILGNIPDEDYGIDSYMAVEDVKVDGNTAYIYVGWYAGTGHMLQNQYVFEAQLDKEGSLAMSSRDEGEAIFPELYDPQYDNRRELFNKDDSETVYTVVEVIEEVDGAAYAIVNTTHPNEAENIGWREAYTIDAMNFYEIKGDKPTLIDEPLEFPENAKLGHNKEYFISNPNDWAYTMDGIDTNTFAKALTLNQVVCETNEIIDEDDWFRDNNISRDFDTGKYRFEVPEYTGDKDYWYEVDLYDKETDVLAYTLELSQFYNPQFVVGDNSGLAAGWRAEFRFGYADENAAYICMAHRTYSDTMLYHAYIMAIDLETGDLLWKSRPLTCNSDNFAVIGDVIVCGYGFTAEPDFIYQLDKNNGFEIDNRRIKTKADYFVYKEDENRLYVRTYDTNYVYEVN